MNETEKRIVKSSWTGKYFIELKERGFFGGEKWVTWCSPVDSEGYGGNDYVFDTPEQAQKHYEDYQKRCSPDSVVKYF